MQLEYDAVADDAADEICATADAAAGTIIVR